MDIFILKAIIKYNSKLIMFLLSIQVATYVYAVVAKERIASLVVLPPLVLGYDELYADSTRYSTEADNEGQSHIEQKQEKGEINKQNENMYSDSELLNVGTQSNDQLNNHNPAKDHRKLSQDLKEVEIAGKLILPHKLFGCNCPNGMHNPNTKH